MDDLDFFFQPVVGTEEIGCKFVSPAKSLEIVLFNLLSRALKTIRKSTHSSVGGEILFLSVISLAVL